MPQFAAKRVDGIATKIRRVRLFQPRLCDVFAVNRFGIDRTSTEACSYGSSSVGVWTVTQVLVGISFLLCLSGIVVSLIAYFTQRLKWMRKTIASLWIGSVVFEIAWMALIGQVHSNTAADFSFAEYDADRHDQVTVVYDVGFYFCSFSAILGAYTALLTSQVSDKDE